MCLCGSIIPYKEFVKPFHMQLSSFLNRFNEPETLKMAKLGRELRADEIVSLLAHYSFSKPTLLAQVEFPESIIPDGVPIRFVEALAKHRNDIWLVHLHDADPFPSNPHAHNEESGLKLHGRPPHSQRANF